MYRNVNGGMELTFSKKSQDACHQELHAIVGENEATSTIVAIYDEIV